MAKKHRKRNQKQKVTKGSTTRNPKELPNERPLERPIEQSEVVYEEALAIADVSKQGFPLVAGQSDVESVAENTPQLAEIGRTGLLQFSGFLHEEDLRQLQDTSKRLKIYKEMRDNSPVIGAILFTMDMFMRQVDWWFEAVDDEPASLEDKEFAESLMDDMSSSWQDTLSEIFSFVPWGWSWHEVVLKVRNGFKPGSPGESSKHKDGRIGWRKIPIRGQDTLNRWLFDDEGGLQGMEQIPAPDYVTRHIPISRSLLFRTQVYKGNPEGKALFRNMFRPWFFAKRVETFEAIGVERDLAGFPVLYVPSDWTSSGATTDEKSAYADAKDIVVNIKRDEQEGLVLPSIFDDDKNRTLSIELLNSGGKRNFDTDKIINRYNMQIALTALADFIFLGHEKVGSFALADSKTNLFSVALGTWLDMIAAVFNRHAMPRLWEMNGLDMETITQLKHGDLETTDPEVIGAFVKSLGAVGLKFDDLETQNFLRRLVDFPEVDEDFLDDNDEVVEAVKDMTKDIKEAIGE